MSATPASDRQEEIPRRASAARVYDYALGGTHNYEVDRLAAHEGMRVFPPAAVLARRNRAFLERAVRYLTGQGIRQFLDLGSGIPAMGNVHEVAAPGAHVVYVDYEPAAVEIGREILVGDPNATTIQADLRDPDIVLGHPDVNALLDFRRPIGLLMLAVLHFVADEEDEPRRMFLGGVARIG